MENINNILQFVASIKSKYDEIAKITGENYNIFHILDIGHLENYHSKIIADLLNPKGLHNQGNTFLKFFLDNFSIGTIDVETIEVFTEYVIDNNRRIDIYLKDNKNQNIIIENKIYAGEQNQQLTDYQKYGKNQHKNSKLFFLTLWGKKSIEHEQLDDYTCISYHSDILKWLELCKEKASDIPVLRETLTQYIFLIKFLTNQTNQEMVNEIVNFISQDEEKLKGFFQMYSCREACAIGIKKGLINDFKMQMQELADEQKVPFDVKNSENNAFVFFHFNIVSDEFKKINLTFELCESNSTLIFGIQIKKGKNYQNSKENLISEINENFKKHFPECCDGNSDWLNYGYTKYDKWNDKNNNESFLAIKTGELKKYIEDILVNAIEIVTDTINKK